MSGLSSASAIYDVHPELRRLTSQWREGDSTMIVGQPRLHRYRPTTLFVLRVYHRRLSDRSSTTPHSKKTYTRYADEWRVGEINWKTHELHWFTSHVCLADAEREVRRLARE